MPRRSSISLGLILCGETRWRREGRLQGDADIPLSNAGRASVAADVGHLVGRRPATIYHPPGEAATETARLIAEVIRAKTREVDDLRDPHLGLFEGMLQAELRERYPRRARQLEDDPLSLTPPDGEPVAAARARQFRAVARLLKKIKSDGAIVLGPLGFAMMGCWLQARPASDLWRLLDETSRIQYYTVATGLVEALRVAGETEQMEA